MKKLVLSEAAIEGALGRIAQQIADRNDQGRQVVVVGIQRRGSYLAQRLAGILGRIWGHGVTVGELDVTMHRDDLSERLTPQIHATTLPGDITQKTVILVDDVVYSGRTTRAALDALNDFGRPKSIQLAVLIDRGHRELPIRPDFVGTEIPTASSDRVSVCLKEEGDEDAVYLESA